MAADKEFAERLHELFTELGRKGGTARAKKLTATERRRIAQEAAKARWSKQKPTSKKGGG